MWDSRSEAERWLKQAENDLDFARLGLREGFHAQVCFLTQQSAEKAVKAIGYLLGERTVLGHPSPFSPGATPGASRSWRTCGT